ncbi:hypothetical protein [Deinococcus aquatilis]|uniref:hypothetical protein n=1 Tax=Deinococcus aquatilis TaxID=519440 RepID=UPI0012F9667B|nr:hypothetical protein [Deinococcus aquatilis]
MLPLLELTVSLLLIARDERRDAQQSTDRVSALLAHFHAVRQEFGPLRVQALRPGTVIARRDRANTILTTYSVLRDLCSQYETALPRKALIEHQLWTLFDAMDVVLAQGFSPDSDPPLFLLVQVTNLWALTHITRAPGMPLPLVVEIGCQLAGHDPLWGWSTLQGLPDPSDLNVTLQYLVQCLEFLGQEQLDPEHQLEVLDLIQQWGCEVFALARQLGLRFPQHDRLEDLLIGPPRAQRQRLLLGEEYGALQARFIAVADAINTHEAELQAQESLEDLTVTLAETPELQAPQHTPLPAAEPSAPEAAPPLLLPAHVLQARSLLAGRHVTLLGGIPDPAHHAALVENLALAGLDWIPSARYDHGHHVPISADTGLVILAVRWMGHAHNGLRDLARQRGIPYVLHPGGLNPSNVAYQVLKQVSHRLHASTSSPVEFNSLNGEHHSPSRRFV